MKWVPDTTGRFQWRPYYDQEELDRECERSITGFLKQKYGQSRFPVSTDDLCVMIEQYASELDLYADLSREGEDVDGVTEFFPDKRPAVRIAQELSTDASNSGRLRTTLAHEYGHVRFHAFLWDGATVRTFGMEVLSKIPAQRRMYGRVRERALSGRANVQRPWPTRSSRLVAASRCTRDFVLDAPLSDWMEWQAGYACGAILMPLSAMRNLVHAEMGDGGRWLTGDSEAAIELVARTAESFDVPADSARVRLEKLGFLRN